MIQQPSDYPLSPQLVPERLPKRSAPFRAFALSLTALVVAALGAVAAPELLASYDSLSWLLILVPLFALTYYRGLKVALQVLTIGALLFLLGELVAQYAFGVAVDWALLFWGTVVLLGLSTGLAILSEFLRQERREALVLAYSDGLTGLPNRRLLDFMLGKEFAAAQRGRPLSVVLLTVDGFGAYNQMYGRRAGDDAMREIGAMLDRQMRMMNIGGRYAGASFLSILSGEKVDGAWVFAERTREAIAGLELPTGSQQTVSIGVASFELRMRTPGELIDAAMRAAGRARSQGGNCVVCETTQDRDPLAADFAKLPAEMQAVREQAWRQQALEEAEIRYRKLLEGVPVGVYRVTPEGEILDANGALIRMFDYPDRQSLLAVNAGELYVDAADRRHWQERLNRETLIRDYEVQLRRYDGSTFWGRDTARAVVGPGGVIRYYQGVLEDITEAKRAREAALKATASLEAVFDAAPVAIFSVDPEGRVLSWNPGAEQIFGWSETEVLGQRFPTVLEDGQQFNELCGRVLSGESLFGEEIRQPKADGKPIDLNVYAAPLYGGNGVTGVMAVMVDVTRHKELESRLAQAHKMESVGQLAGGVAHDFNNLLTVILGDCEMMLADMPTTSPWRNDLTEIRSAAKHAAGLTRQLLAFSRRQILQPRIINLNSVVSETLEMLGRLIGEHIELDVQLDPALASTKADPVEMGQVLMNLAVNARDAMPRGGRLTIKTERIALEVPTVFQGDTIPPGDYVALKVADTGVGMDEETRARIFEPFFTTKEKGRGTGLGLATVYGIVKQSGGYISVNSVPDRGTSFRVYLPVCDGRAGLESRSEARPEGGCETILFVEDNPSVRSSARRGLENAGYTVLEAGDASEALEIIRGHSGSIHLMVTDLVLPGKSGLELGQDVVKLRPQMKVLYTSGYTDDDVARHGFTDPNRPFLAKPYTPLALRERIRDMLD